MGKVRGSRLYKLIPSPAGGLVGAVSPWKPETLEDYRVLVLVLTVECFWYSPSINNHLLKYLNNYIILSKFLGGGKSRGAPPI